MKSFDTLGAYTTVLRVQPVVHHATGTTRALGSAEGTWRRMQPRVWPLQDLLLWSQSVYFHARRPRMAAAPRSRGALGVTAAMPKAKDLRECSKEELMQMVESARLSMLNVKEMKARRDQVGASVTPSNSLTAVIA